MQISIDSRLQTLEAQESLTGIMVTSPPNGTITSTVGVFAFEKDNNGNVVHLYACVGGTTWVQIF